MITSGPSFGWKRLPVSHGKRSSSKQRNVQSRETTLRVALAYSPGARPGGVTHVRWADVSADGGEPKWNDIHGVPHNYVYSLAFRPDGNRLAIGCAGHIHVAPIGCGQPLTFPTELLVGELAFSEDGAWMVVSGGAGSDPAIRWHQFPASEPLAVYIPKATRTRRLVFAPDRPTLVALAGKLVILLRAGARTAGLDEGTHGAGG